MTQPKKIKEFMEQQKTIFMGIISFIPITAMLIYRSELQHYIGTFDIMTLLNTVDADDFIKAVQLISLFDM